jgi:hypothetical protein
VERILLLDLLNSKGTKGAANDKCKSKKIYNNMPGFDTFSNKNI